MICKSKIAVTKKLAQRFQRDDFCSRKTPVSRTSLGYFVEKRSAGRNDFSATISPVCVRPGPLLLNLPATAPLAILETETPGSRD